MNKTLSKTLSQAFDMLTADLLKSLGYGEERILNDNYSVYSYADMEYYTIRERATDEEVYVVQFGDGDDLVLTEI